MVNMNTVSSALKNFYIMPLREDINLKADAFASRVMRTEDNIVGYNKIVRAALVGANGGAGAGSETGALPVRTAFSPRISGGSNCPARCWISVIARPTHSAGISSVNS